MNARDFDQHPGMLMKTFIEIFGLRVPRVVGGGSAGIIIDGSYVRYVSTAVVVGSKPFGAEAAAAAAAAAAAVGPHPFLSSLVI